jgi:hypothetical protein
MSSFDASTMHAWFAVSLLVTAVFADSNGPVIGILTQPWSNERTYCFGGTAPSCACISCG